jgi:hypothetical protein
MIKRLLFISAITMGLAYTASAQCTPGSAIATAPQGTILPDSATGLPPAYAGNPNGYNTTLDIKTLTDTVVEYQSQQVTVYVHEMRIEPTKNIKVINSACPNSECALPNGFTWTANYSTSWVNTGTAPNQTPVTGCVLVTANQSSVQAALTGGPNNDGVYPLRIYVDIKFTAPSLFITTPNWISTNSTFSSMIPTNENYRLRILNGTSIIEANNNDFRVVANVPNPFANNTEILFTLPANGQATLKVYNMLGKEVYNTTVNGQEGDNRIPVSAENLASGIYLYNLTYNNTTITKKMIVEKN